MPTPNDFRAISGNNTMPLRIASGRVKEQLLGRNMKQFRGGPAFKAFRPLYHSTLGSGVMKKKREGSHGSFTCRFHAVDYNPFIKSQLA